MSSGIFFSEHKVKDDEGPKSPPPNGNIRMGINTRDGEDFIDSECADGTHLITKIEDNPNLPMGQLFIVHPLGLIDYNDLVDKVTGNSKNG